MAFCVRPFLYSFSQHDQETISGSIKEDRPSRLDSHFLREKDFWMTLNYNETLIKQNAVNYKLMLDIQGQNLMSMGIVGKHQKNSRCGKEWEHEGFAFHYIMIPHRHKSDEAIAGDGLPQDCT